MRFAGAACRRAEPVITTFDGAPFPVGIVPSVVAEAGFYLFVTQCKCRGLMQTIIGSCNDPAGFCADDADAFNHRSRHLVQTRRGAHQLSKARPIRSGFPRTATFCPPRPSSTKLSAGSISARFYIQLGQRLS